VRGKEILKHTPGRALVGGIERGHQFVEADLLQCRGGISDLAERLPNGCEVLQSHRQGFAGLTVEVATDLFSDRSLPVGIDPIGERLDVGVGDPSPSSAGE
jgi:hypothetical protein